MRINGFQHENFPIINHSDPPSLTPITVSSPCTQALVTDMMISGWIKFHSLLLWLLWSVIKQDAL